MTTAYIILHAVDYEQWDVVKVFTDAALAEAYYATVSAESPSEYELQTAPLANEAPKFTSVLRLGWDSLTPEEELTTENYIEEGTVTSLLTPLETSVTSINGVAFVDVWGWEHGEVRKQFNALVRAEKEKLNG